MSYNIINKASIKKLDAYNEIKISYGWDYANEVYIGEYIYPESDTLNASYQTTSRKRSVTIYMPALYNLDEVKVWAKRVYAMWSFGVVYATQEKTVDAYGETYFNPDAGYGTSIYYHFIITKKYLSFGANARVFIEGFAEEEDHFDLWDWA